MNNGTIIKKYEIISVLGKGGMGVVYHARDTELDREVAIKCITPNLTEDVTIRKRFVREARIQAKLIHHNICILHDAFEEEGRLFSVMELLDGETLSEKIEREGPLSTKEIKNISHGILEGLSYIHSKGIVHRDIKPSNIIITKDGKIKLMDLGIARAFEKDGTSLTQSKQTIGTPTYMSPEQVKGEEISLSSDIYSFGMTLYEMLTGELPFDDTSSNYKIYDFHVRGRAPSALSKNPQASRKLSRIATKALSKQQLKRFANAKEVQKIIKTVPIKQNKKSERKISIPLIVATTVSSTIAIILIIVAIVGGIYYLKERTSKNSLRNHNINIAEGLITNNKFTDAKNKIREYIATSDDASNLYKRIVRLEKEYNVCQKAEKLNPISLTQITDFVDANRQKVSIEIIEKCKKELYEKLNKNAIGKIETTGLDSTGFIAILKNMYSPKQPPEIVLNKLIEKAKTYNSTDLIKKKYLLSKITTTFPNTKSELNSKIDRLKEKITRQIEPKMKAALVKIDKYIEAGKLNEAAIEIKNIKDYSSYSTTNFSQIKSKFNLIKNWKDVIQNAPVAIKYKNICFVGYTNDQILLPIWDKLYVEIKSDSIYPWDISNNKTAQPEKIIQIKKELVNILKSKPYAFLSKNQPQGKKPTININDNSKCYNKKTLENTSEKLIKYKEALEKQTNGGIKITDMREGTKFVIGRDDEPITDVKEKTNYIIKFDYVPKKIQNLKDATETVSMYVKAKLIKKANIFTKKKFMYFGTFKVLKSYSWIDDSQNGYQLDNKFKIQNPEFDYFIASSIGKKTGLIFPAGHADSLLKNQENKRKKEIIELNKQESHKNSLLKLYPEYNPKHKKSP